MCLQFIKNLFLSLGLRNNGDNAKSDPCRIISFPTSRNVVIDVLRVGKLKHHVFGMGEIDITQVRKYLQDQKTKNENLSLSAYMVFCLATAIGENPSIQAIKKGKKLYLFEDVDITMVVELDGPHGKAPVNFIIRQAQKKSFREINTEIRNAQSAEYTGAVLGENKEAKQASTFAKMPGFIRRLVWWKVRNDPHFLKKMIGTACVSAVGMFGPHSGGWALGPTVFPIALIIGGIARRPGVVEDRIEIREFVAVTLCVDHDVVDGGPAARFAARLIDLLEVGYGLNS
jgi:hypothetical protein